MGKLTSFTMSIATKLILATLLLVAAAMIPMAYQTVKYFEHVSIAKEEEANLSSALSRAAEVETILQGLIDKSKSLGVTYLQSEKTPDQSTSTNEKSMLDGDRDIFAVEIYTLEGGDFKLKKSLLKRQAFAKKGKDETLLARIRQKSPFPISSVAQGQIEIMTAASDHDLPLMIIGTPVQRNDLGQVSVMTLTYFELARLQRIFSNVADRSVFLLDSRGQVLAHPNEKWVLEGKSFADHPALQRTIAEGLLRLQTTYELKLNDVASTFYGAVVKTALGPLVVSEIPERLVVMPAREARHNAILITGVVMSLAIFVVFLLSMTFSGPIEILAAFIREVSSGNYAVSAQDKIKSKDELGILAKAFDEMVTGLKERAKAYAVMHQAIGASVVETLMNMKEEELGGQKKPVTVLFSDLRDFTKFSEGNSPEQVVEMLNEYFDVMVKTITDHKGWLDKFIGDAIMSVWGVPYTGDDDAADAINAALDMRTALAVLNEKRIERGDIPIRIGIGLHCGDAIVGKIGAAVRANLTVIGDTVNQASRIEASTKAFGTDLLLSQELFEVAKDRFVCELAGSVEVKGKAEPLRLYKVRGRRLANGEVELVQTPYSDYTAEGADKVKLVS